MNATFAPYQQLLLQPLYEWRVRSSLALTWILLAAGTIGFVGFGVIGGAWRIGMMMFSSTFGIALFLWWGIYIRCAVRMNTPAHARLTPGLRQRLIVLTVSLALTGIAVLAVLFALCTGRFSYAPVVAAAVFLYVALVQRHLWAVIFGALPLIVTTLSRRAFFQPVVQLVQGYDQQQLIAVELTVLTIAGWCALRSLFPAGGDRHVSWTQRMGDAERIMRGGAPAASASRRWSTEMQLGYFAALRRDSMPGRTVPAGRMLMHAFGPGAHTGFYILFSLGMLVALGGLSIYLDMDQVPPSRSMIGIAQLFTMLPALFYADDAGRAIVRTVAEQGLLRLAPNMLQGAGLNRVFGRALLSRFMGVWLVAALCSTAIPMFVTHRLEMDSGSIALAAMFLTLSCQALRDYAHWRTDRPPAALSAITMVLVLIFVALNSLQTALKLVPTSLFGAICVIPTLLVLGMRWRRMQTWPAALPAGRLATSEAKYEVMK